MFLRIDKLGVELPASTKYDPTAAAAVQELLGGRFGEMSTLNNYLHQSAAIPWSGDYVFNSGNLVMDLLHNFFLETGARSHKARVYEMTSNETARTMIGYLLVRGGVHQAAYALALEKLTGVNMTKMLPVPNIDNKKFKHTRAFESKSEHTKLYTFSPSDYQNLG